MNCLMVRPSDRSIMALFCNFRPILQFLPLFSLTGMVINKDFQAMGREANEYALGNSMYYLVLGVIAVVWQLYFIGGLGVIFCANSLLNGVLSAVLLPITNVAAVICYHENFNGLKAMPLVLYLWGFTSYFCGEYKMIRMNKKLENSTKTEQGGDNGPNAAISSV